MSLLNQVLIDLDRRRASGEERGALPDHVRALPHEPERGMSLRLLALLAALTVAAAFAAYRFDAWSRLRHYVAAPVPAPVAVPAAPAPAPVPAAAAPEPPTPAFEAMQPRLADIPIADVAPRPLPPALAAPRKEARPSPVASADARARPPAATVEDTPAGEEPPADIRKQVRKPSPLQQAELDYRKAAALLQQGRPAEARELLESALQAHPAHAGARQALTGMLIEAQAYGEAERLLQEGLAVAPAHSGYAIALARLKVYRSDVAGAIETLQGSAEHGAQNAEYQGFFAALLQRQQRHDEAIERFRAALRLKPQSGVWLMGLGISLQATNRLAEAQDAYRRAKSAAGLTPELQAFVDQRLRQVQ